jgi:dephospho-CoA kinase
MGAEKQAGIVQVATAGHTVSDIVIGLTGGIGSGKSTVADLFAAQGVAVVDTDLIAHDLTGPTGAAMPEILAAFGDSVRQPNGGLDRVAMRRQVFADPQVRQQLEGILHPRIRSEAERRCRLATTPYVLLVVPLLIESGAYRDRVRRVLVVDCDEATQVARVVARSGLSPDEVRRIIATQLARAERLAAADDVIVNMAGVAALEPQVLAMHERYLRLGYDEGDNNG